MPLLFFLAVTVIGKEHRVGWFDFSYLDILGGIGAIVFSMRFVVQWLASEKAKESVVPVSFWYWSIAGSLIMLIYFICKREFIGTLLYLPNTWIYLRNLALIRKKKKASAVAVAETETAAPATKEVP